MLTSEQAELKSRKAEVHWLEEQVLATEVDSEALHVACARVSHICKLEVDAATLDGESGVVVRTVPSLKRRVTTEKDRTNTSENWV